MSKKRKRRAKRSSSRLPQLFAMLVIFSVFSFIIISVVFFSEMEEESEIIPEKSKIVIESMEKSSIPALDSEVCINHITLRANKTCTYFVWKWIPILRSGEIIHIDSYNNGLSVKFKATFSTGHQAMIKLAEGINIFGHSRNSYLSWEE